MNEEPISTDLNDPHKSSIHYEFLNTLEEDLIDLRREIAIIKKTKILKEKKLPQFNKEDLKMLDEEVRELRSVIVNKRETDRMLHIRLRREISACVECLAECIGKKGSDPRPGKIGGVTNLPMRAGPSLFRKI